MDATDTAISNLPTFWKTVWTSLSTKHTVILSTYGYLKIVKRNAQTGYTEKNFWSMSTGKADKKGWDWWGDTDVYVTEITGPKTFEEVFIKYFNNYANFF